MKVRDVLQKLIAETELNDEVVIFDRESGQYKEILVQKFGSTVFFNIQDREKSDIEIREDFFR